MKIRFDDFFYSDGAYHGPTSWPWWKLFGVSWVKISVHPPSWGRRLIFYRPTDKPPVNYAYFKGSPNRSYALGFVVVRR